MRNTQSSVCRSHRGNAPEVCCRGCVSRGTDNRSDHSVCCHVLFGIRRVSSHTPDLQDVTEKLGFASYRVDETLEKKYDRIIPAIIEGIRKSAFVIADVTEPKPNVYYELGLAHGAAKPVIVTAKKDTPRPFDIFDLPIVYWSDLDSLAAELKERVQEIAKNFGR